jgi:DNA-binding NarL/FixJ family response regulator
MARPHSGHDYFLRYLKDGFSWKQTYVAIPDGEEFSAEKVAQALSYLKSANPTKYRILDLSISTGRSRSEISGSLHLDPSTIKRYLNQALDLIMLKLRYENLISDKYFLDLRNILHD